MAASLKQQVAEARQFCSERRDIPLREQITAVTRLIELEKALRVEQVAEVRALLMQDRIAEAKALLDEAVEPLRMEGYAVNGCHNSRLIGDCPDVSDLVRMPAPDQPVAPANQLIDWRIALQKGKNPLKPAPITPGKWRFGFVHSSEPGWFGEMTGEDLVVLADLQYQDTMYNSLGEPSSFTAHQTAICWRGPLPEGCIEGDVKLPHKPHGLVEVDPVRMAAYLDACDGVGTEVLSRRLERFGIRGAGLHVGRGLIAPDGDLIRAMVAEGVA